MNTLFRLSSAPRLHVCILAAFILHPSSFILAQGGSLTPPGAPAPTMKTLDQIDAKLEKRTPISALPLTISTSGSYFVTGNLTTTVGGNGLTISADNVTLDLNGFELAGNGAPGIFGIRVSVGRTNVIIRNGTVRGWTGSGVVTENAAVTGVRVEAVRALGNGSAGIALGAGCTAVDCLASGNVAHGISTGDECTVLRCTSRGNTPSGDGINAGARCLIQGCVATGNAGHGIKTGDSCAVSGCTASGNTTKGVFCANGCLLRDCTANGNGNTAFQLGNASSATGCSATGNTFGGAFFFSNDARVTQCSAVGNAGAGIQAGGDATIEGCLVASNTGTGIVTSGGAVVADSTVRANNPNGITVGSFGIVRDCTVDANTGSVTSSQGINASVGCVVIHCSVGFTNSTAGTLTGSTGAGIVAGSGSTVQDCAVFSNTGDGIRATDSCTLAGNVCSGNGSGLGSGAGIHTTGALNRIDGNHVVQNDRGIEVSSTSNTIVRNTAVGNTSNFEMAASNNVGPVVIPANSAAISGNGALAGSLGSTDPWANFSK